MHFQLYDIFFENVRNNSISFGLYASSIFLLQLKKLQNSFYIHKKIKKFSRGMNRQKSKRTCHLFSDITSFVYDQRYVSIHRSFSLTKTFSKLYSKFYYKTDNNFDIHC